MRSGSMQQDKSLPLCMKQPKNGDGGHQNLCEWECAAITVKRTGRNKWLVGLGGLVEKNPKSFQGQIKERYQREKRNVDRIVNLTGCETVVATARIQIL